jgi:hypothetical protein
MRSFAGLMLAIGIGLLVASPIACVMQRLYAANARTPRTARNDIDFERHRAVAERLIVPCLLAGLIALAVSGVALLLAVATG